MPVDRASGTRGTTSGTRKKAALDLAKAKHYKIPLPLPELADLVDRCRPDLIKGVQEKVKDRMSGEWAKSARSQAGRRRLHKYFSLFTEALRSGEMESFLANQKEQVKRYARRGVPLEEVETLDDCIGDTLHEVLLGTATTLDQRLAINWSWQVLEKFINASSFLAARHYILAREEELSMKEALLKRLAGRLMTAQEEERGRIAQDIHDELIQLLFGLRYELDLVDSKLDKRQFDGAKEEMRTMKERIDQGLSELRRLLRSLRPAVLDDLGLVPALNILVRQLDQSTGIEMDFQVKGKECRLPLSTETCLYRVAQEALHNTVKHAEASHVLATLSIQKNHTRLAVEDDGMGFKSEAYADGGGLSQDKFGLYGMSERVQSHGGTLRIDSRPGRGTRVVATLPLDDGKA